MPGSIAMAVACPAVDMQSSLVLKDPFGRSYASVEPVSLKNLSDIDRKGIADGKAYAGMSKEGVRIALGYPASQQDPIIEQQHLGIRKEQMDLNSK